MPPFVPPVVSSSLRDRKLAAPTVAPTASEFIPTGESAVARPLTISEKPGVAWPGGRGQAEWPRGKQPLSGEGWPRMGDGMKKPCWKTAVLEDHATGWLATCTGLTVIKEYTTLQQCQEGCQTTVTCSVWRFGAGSAGDSIISSSPTGQSSATCYFGRGDNCHSATAMDSVGAQRIQHGDVLVLADMSNWEVKNLLNVGLFDHGTGTQAIPRCRHLCYSDVECEYWAYGQGGCWVERPSEGNHRAGYPLLPGTATTNTSDFAKVIRASEYIQHSCPSDNTETGFDMNMLAKAFAGIACVMLVVGVAVFFLQRWCCQGKRSKRATKKRSRAVKAEAIEASTPETAGLLMPSYSLQPMQQGYSLPSHSAAPLPGYMQPGYGPMQPQGY